MAKRPPEAKPIPDNVATQTKPHQALSVMLQGYRALFGVSQRNAARLAGLATSHLARIESLAGRPSADSLWRLSGAIAGAEGHPDSDRWRVLMAAAFLSWPEPQFLLAVFGSPYDADLVWSWAEQAAMVWAQVATERQSGDSDLDDAQYRNVLAHMWTLYVSRGSEWWPRFTSAAAAGGVPGLGMEVTAAATTAWFDLLWRADRPALELVARAVATQPTQISDLALSAKALLDTWVLGGKTPVLHRPDREWEETWRALWPKLSGPARQALLAAARVLADESASTHSH